MYFLLERRLDQCPDRALLVWSPTAEIPDHKCKYLSNSKLFKKFLFFKFVFFILF